jgi:hypothetical protein
MVWANILSLSKALCGNEAHKSLERAMSMAEAVGIRPLDVQNMKELKPLTELPKIGVTIQEEKKSRPIQKPVLEMVFANPLGNGKQWEVVFKVEGQGNYWSILTPGTWSKFLKRTKKSGLKEGLVKVLKKESLAYKDLGEVQVLTVERLEQMAEAFGDDPNWMRIKSYHRHKKNRRLGEMVLTLKDKPYWFPVSRQVYERFRGYANHRFYGRGKALQYLQKYIRRFREYKGRMTKRYFNAQRIKPKTKAKSVMGSSSLPTPFGEAVAVSRNIQQDDFPPLIQKLVSGSGVSYEHAAAFYDLKKQGMSNSGIASKIGIATTQADLLSNLLQAFSDSNRIRTDSKQDVLASIRKIREGGNASDIAKKLLTKEVSDEAV